MADLIAQLGSLATEEPEWKETFSSNVGAIRFWKEHPYEHQAVIEVYFKTSDMTYGYAASHQTYYAIIGSGSRGKAVHRLLVPRGYLYKRAGR